MAEKKKHYAGKDSPRASCGAWLAPEDPRVTNSEDFWKADADGSLCQRRLRSATNEASPY